EIHTDPKWEFIIALASNGLIGSAEIDAALEADRTASGQQFAAYARAALPTSEATEGAWSQMVETPGVANLIIRFSALGFNRVHNPEVLVPFIDRYFDIVQTVWES